MHSQQQTVVATTANRQPQVIRQALRTTDQQLPYIDPNATELSQDERNLQSCISGVSWLKTIVALAIFITEIIIFSKSFPIGRSEVCQYIDGDKHYPSPVFEVQPANLYLATWPFVVATLWFLATFFYACCSSCDKQYFTAWYNNYNRKLSMGVPSSFSYVLFLPLLYIPVIYHGGFMCGSEIDYAVFTLIGTNLSWYILRAQNNGRYLFGIFIFQFLKFYILLSLILHRTSPDTIVIAFIIIDIVVSTIRIIMVLIRNAYDISTHRWVEIYIQLILDLHLVIAIIFSAILAKIQITLPSTTITPFAPPMVTSN